MFCSLFCSLVVALVVMIVVLVFVVVVLVVFVVVCIVVVKLLLAFDSYIIFNEAESFLHQQKQLTPPPSPSFYPPSFCIVSLVALDLLCLVFCVCVYLS